MVIFFFFTLKIISSLQILRSWGVLSRKWKTLWEKQNLVSREGTSSQISRSELGSFSNPAIPEKVKYKYRKLISETILKCDEEKDLAKAVQLHLQGFWTSWCAYVKNNLSWKTVLALPSPLFNFIFSSIYNTLPSPSNLTRWKIPNVEPSCTSC